VCGKRLEATLCASEGRPVRTLCRERGTEGQGGGDEPRQERRREDREVERDCDGYGGHQGCRGQLNTARRTPPGLPNASADQAAAIQAHAALRAQEAAFTIEAIALSMDRTQVHSVATTSTQPHVMATPRFAAPTTWAFQLAARLGSGAIRLLLDPIDALMQMRRWLYRRIVSPSGSVACFSMFYFSRGALFPRSIFFSS